MLFPYESSKREARERLGARQLFFGLAVYRSGTTFLASLLHREYSHAMVKHEANVFDYLAYAQALGDEEAASRYLNSYRLPELYHRLSPLDTQVYGEINPFLRRHAVALRTALPKARIFMIVRNGRDVVRSLLAREFFESYDPMAPLIRPPRSDPMFVKWASLTRVEKVCWMWAADNRFLLKHVPHCIQLESLLSDYEYFTQSLTEFVGLPPMSKDRWLSATREHVNRTPPTAKENVKWGAYEEQVFEEICGEVQAKLGYK